MVISALLEGSEVNAEDLSEDEASCLEEWVAGANLLAFVVTPDDPAVIDDFIAQLERCAPNLLGFTTATGTPAMTPHAGANGYTDHGSYGYPNGHTHADTYGHAHTGTNSHCTIDGCRSVFACLPFDTVH